MADSKSKAWSDGGCADNIVTMGGPSLRASCEVVENVADVQEDIDGLIASLREMGGAGLAANQMGLNKRIAIVEVRKTELFPDRPESPLLVLVNPRIVHYGNHITSDWEGCYSVPNVMAKVSRPDEIIVKYLDREGNEQERAFFGYVSRVIQHEVDHLYGTLFIDKVTDVSTFTTVENWKKYSL